MDTRSGTRKAIDDARMQDLHELGEQLRTKQITRKMYYDATIQLYAKWIKAWSQQVQSDRNATVQLPNSSAAGTQPMQLDQDAILSQPPNSSLDVSCIGGAVAHAVLLDFVKDLRVATLVDAVLSVPDDACIGGTRELSFLYGKFLVRQCYSELKDIMIAMSGNPSTSNFLVTGTPGIGKSYFSYYMIYELMKTKKTIVWQPAGFSEVVCITLTTISFARELCAFKKQLNQLSTWYIVDGQPPGEFTATTLLVATPDPEICRKFRKCGAVTRYMPVWSYEELKKAKACGVALSQDGRRELEMSEIDELYRKWGGIPRYVFQFARDTYEQQSVYGAIYNVDIATLCKFDGETKGDDPRHIVMHMKAMTDCPEEDRYNTCVMVFASADIRELMFQEVLHSKHECIKQSIASAARDPMTAELRGALFEAYAHCLLRSGRQFTVRNLDTNASAGNNAFKVTFGKAEIFDCGTWSEVVDKKRRYYRPKRESLQGIDSLMYPNNLFKMTVSGRRDIDVDEIQAVVDHIVSEEQEAKRNIRLFFVVLSEKFNRMKLQRYTSNGKPVDAPTFKSGVCVEQYALALDITSDYFSKMELDEEKSSVYP